MNLIADLQARGLIQDITPGTEEQLMKEMTSGYIGFDPTADSLHVGSLLPITLLMRFQKAGHKPYVLIGGATGRVGDPTGKTAERPILDEEALNKNIAGIEAQLRKFLDKDDQAANKAVFINNYDWFKTFTFLDFIRDVGKFMTVNYMLSKDSVQKRLEYGMSFTEFTYQLIQAYDFYYLLTQHNVRLQMGGADQWGNITSGTELIRKKGVERDTFAFTCKLVTKSDGSKFGKSEGGNIWLDPAKTSPYQFYQFWLQLSDEDAERMAMIFSFEPVEVIQSWINTHRENPGLRTLHKNLAKEMTQLVHGEAAVEFAEKASQILFGRFTLETLQSLNEAELLEIFSGVPQVHISKTAWENAELLSFLAEHQILPSKGEARKMIGNGAISVNKEKITDVQARLSQSALLNDAYQLIQKGKNNFTLVKVLP